MWSCVSNTTSDLHGLRHFFVQSACTTLALTFDGKLNQLCLHTMQAGKVPGPPHPDAAEVPGAAGKDLLKVAF